MTEKTYKINTDIIDSGYNLWEGYWQSSVYQEYDGFIHFVLDVSKTKCNKVYFTFRDGDTFKLSGVDSVTQNIDDSSMFRMVVSGYLSNRKLVFKLFGDKNNDYIQGIFETECPIDGGTFYINNTEVRHFEYQVDDDKWCLVM